MKKYRLSIARCGDPGFLEFYDEEDCTYNCEVSIVTNLQANEPTIHGLDWPTTWLKL